MSRALQLGDIVWSPLWGEPRFESPPPFVLTIELKKKGWIHSMNTLENLYTS